MKTLTDLRAEWEKDGTVVLLVAENPSQAVNERQRTVFIIARWSESSEQSFIALYRYFWIGGADDGSWNVSVDASFTSLDSKDISLAASENTALLACMDRITQEFKGLIPR